MANVIKLIVPLLDKSFEKEDISEESGFVEGYLQDINRPYLDNHIFLLYDGKLDTVAKLKRDEKIRKMPTLYGRYTIHIKNVPYLLYVFSIINKSINFIRSCGSRPLNEKDFINIQKFWMFEDPFITSLITSQYKTTDIDGLIVPEEDYAPDIEDEICGQLLQNTK